MTANKEMNSDFLKNSRSKSLTSDKRTMTIEWDCTPGKVYYNYVIPGGSTQRKGYYNHSGIYRYRDGDDGMGYYKMSPRYDLFEGIKCVKIQYRKNSGSWTTVSDAAGLSSAKLKRTFTSTSNGDTFEIKCTYQVWTMGSPFRRVPFMWFGDGSGNYNSGANKFSQSSPASPGRTWSGMRNYTKTGNQGTDQNSSWKITDYSWYQPNSTSIKTNWSYLHAKDTKGSDRVSGTTAYGKDAWLSTYACEKYYKEMLHGTDKGWTGNVTGISPQITRKSSWWVFEKTYTDSFTTSGITERPDPLSNPTVTLKVINNLGVADSNNRYNGIKGTVKVTYKQAQGASGTYKIWANQESTSSGARMVLVASGSINNGATKSHTINFADYDLVRSGTIAYYAEVFTEDPEYNKTRVARTANDSFINMTANGTHYYNEEPMYPNSFTFTSKDKSKSMNLSWSKCTDPDGHSVTYNLYIYRSNGDNSNEVKLRVKSGSSYSVKTINYADMLTTSNTSYQLDTSKYKGEDITIYVSPRDKYYNNYYYANYIGEACVQDVEISLNVIDNMAAKKGDSGTIKYTYKHRNNLSADVKIYAYIADTINNKSSSGKYVGLVYSANGVKPGTYSVEIDFETAKIYRGYYIKYFAIATDSNGITNTVPYTQISAKMWKHATGYHHFNALPTAVTPFVTEAGEEIFNDGKLEIAWPESSDVEGHEIYYKLYIEVVGQTKYTDTFYLNSTGDPRTRNYTKVIDLGSTTLPTKYEPYTIDVNDYIGSTVYIWITTYDAYNSKKYLSGNKLDASNPGVAPEIPSIYLDYAYGKDIFGETKINGEAGYVSVSYSHPAGRAGTVYLYGMCKKIDSEQIIVYDKPIYSWNLSSGMWSADTLIDFNIAFGQNGRGSEVRYYAVAVTVENEWSVDEREAWKPAASMWDDWVPSHKYNEVPGDITVSINADETDLHEVLTVEWPEAEDPDDTASNPNYAVVLAVDGDLRSNMTFHYGSDKTHDRLRSFTEMWSTPNTKVEIDLTRWPEGTGITLWVVPYDDYANSYLYTSNDVTFSKTVYGRPIITSSIEQIDSEKGILTLRYTHEDLIESNGSFTSKDPYRDAATDFDATVDIYCYVDGSYTSNNSITGETFVPGETKTYEIDFENVWPYERSVEIRYLAIATDNNTGMKNTDSRPQNAASYELTEYYHYYNDEPYDPYITTGPLLNEEDRKNYGFDYINIEWSPVEEPDGDDKYYYLYVDASLAADSVSDIQQATLYSREGPEVFSYTRKYRLLETPTGCTVEYYDNGQYTQIQTNPFLGIRIDFKSDHLGKPWAENQLYKMRVEVRDHRTWTNSYYGVSNIYEASRQRHVPPNEVKLDVIYNLTDSSGDGESGRMTVLYTHSEKLEGTVNIYAYQDDALAGLVYSGVFTHNVQQTITINFTDYDFLDRSKNITYYAEAIDNLVGFTNLDNFPGITKEYIPYLVPDENGEYKYHAINIDGVLYDFNEGDKYIGPVQKGIHFFNEEPPGTSPELFDETAVSYKTAEIKWEHVVDPDGHDVSYEIYVAGTDADEGMNTLYADFFNDNIPKPDDNHIEQESSETEFVPSTVTNTISAAVGTLRYSKMVKIPASSAADAAQRFNVSTEEYSEDSTVNIWIVSKDPYLNSYYRAGNILSIVKGHSAKAPMGIYPRNGSTVYATQPRILIKLADDNQVQTVYVGWKAEEYNNAEHSQYFSRIPGVHNMIVFKPPVVYTDLNNTKVPYYVYVHNQSGYSDKIHATYTYKNFFENFSDDRLIALKSDHINEFRKAIDITRDAYGIPSAKYTRDIKKGMFMENYDFNETKDAISAVNDLLNDADDTDNLDYRNPLIVNLKDLDVTEYEGDIEAGSYTEFLEWARLVYILQNL